jgi:hypothetical protein
MSRDGPRNVLPFSPRKGVSVHLRRTPSFSNDGAADPNIQRVLNRLQAENSELRGKAIDLILQIRLLQGR